MTREHEKWLQELGVPRELFGAPETKPEIKEVRTGPPGEPAASPRLPASRPVARSEPGFGNQPRVLPPPDPKKDIGKKEKHSSGLMKETPYGYILFYLPFKHTLTKTFDEFSIDATAYDNVARSSREAVDKFLSGEQDVKSFAEKHIKSLESEIEANKSPAATDVARDMEQQRQHMSLVSTVFDTLKILIEQAQGHVGSAMKRVQSIMDLEDARRLNEKAADWNNQFTSALGMWGAVIDFTAKVGAPGALLTKLPGLAKPVWDVYSAIVKLKANNPFAKEAAAKQRSGVNAALQAANDDIDNATRTIDSVTKKAEDAEKQLKTSVKYYLDIQTKSEGLYDKSTRGGFKFGTLVKHLDWTEKGMTLTSKSVSDFETAYFHADKLREAYRGVMTGMSLKDEHSDLLIEGSLTVKAMANAHAKAKVEEQAKHKRIGGLNGSLTMTREVADRTLSNQAAPKKK